MTAKLLTLGLIGWILIWTLNCPAGLDLTTVNLLAATTAWVGVGLSSASAALAAGALTGRRIGGIGVGAGVAVTGYVLQAIANNSKDLDGLRVLSPYDWAFGQAPLANGMDWIGLGLLWGGSALLIALATAGLARRDVLG
ncbi:hypothetical protein [Microbacterium deminutum]|uniref:hypothetical protein n=1 Tax=Microbacterium deminutum TaxID=344164 RepID=UPI0031E365BC